MNSTKAIPPKNKFSQLFSKNKTSIKEIENIENIENKPNKDSLFDNSIAHSKIHTQHNSKIINKLEKTPKNEKKKVFGGLKFQGKIIEKKKSEKSKNLFSKIKLGRITGKGVGMEEKLKIPYNHVPVEFLNFDYNEELEDEALEQEESYSSDLGDTDKIEDFAVKRIMTKRTTKKTKRDKNQNWNKAINLNQNKKETKVEKYLQEFIFNKRRNLAKNLKMKQSGKMDHLIEGSVGSSQYSLFSNRNYTKRIKKMMLERKAPKTLKNAFRALVLSLFLCIFITISSDFFNFYLLDNLKNLINEANNLTSINVQFNKIAVYVELENLDEITSTKFKEKITNFYSKEKMNFVKKYTEDSLEDFSLLIDDITTKIAEKSSKRKPVSELLFLDGNFKIGENIYNLPYFSFLSLTTHSALEYFNNRDKEIISKLTSENFKETLIIQNSGYKTITDEIKISSDYVEQSLKISIFSRFLLIFLSSLIAFPLIYKSTKKTGRILLQISKISQINITFYIQHYNKMSFLLKEDKKYENILEKAIDHYNDEYELKKRREQLVGFMGGLKFAKLGQKMKYKWIKLGFLFCFVMVILQSGKIFKDLLYKKTSINEKIGHIMIYGEFANRAIAYNRLSLNISAEKISQEKGYESRLEENLNLLTEVKIFLRNFLTKVYS